MDRFRTGRDIQGYRNLTICGIFWTLEPTVSNIMKNILIQFQRGRQMKQKRIVHQDFIRPMTESSTYIKLVTFEMERIKQAVKEPDD